MFDQGQEHEPPWPLTRPRRLFALRFKRPTFKTQRDEVCRFPLTSAPSNRLGLARSPRIAAAGATKYESGRRSAPAGPGQRPVPPTIPGMQVHAHVRIGRRAGHQKIFASAVAPPSPPLHVKFRPPSSPRPISPALLHLNHLRLHCHPPLHRRRGISTVARRPSDAMADEITHPTIQGTYPARQHCPTRVPAGL